MDISTQEKLLLASIVNLTASRDETVFRINALLNSSYTETVDYVGEINNLFEKLSRQELSIETIQVYYSRHFKQPENDTTS